MDTTDIVCARPRFFIGGTLLLYNGIIRLLTAGVRTGLAAAVMAVTVPMIIFAQTTEPAIEVANASPTGGGNGANNDTSAQTDPAARPAVSAQVEVEFQRLLTEHRREVLDDRAEYIDRWLFVIAILLALFTVVVAIAGLFSFKRFQEIKGEAKKSADEAKKFADSVAKDAKDAKRHVEEIKAKRDEAGLFQSINAETAETAEDDPDKARQAVKRFEENLEASLIDKAIADAVSLQQQGKRDDASKEWHAIAQVAEKSDNNLAARAWFFAGYLARNKSPEDRISAYDKATRLKPDYAEAYSNRGVAKDALKRYDDAIADYDEAIILKPDYAEAYSNRGNAKVRLGRHDDAIADYDEAIILKPDAAKAYGNRGIAKRASGDTEGARKDLKTARELARNAGNASIVSRAEQLLRDLDADGG